MSEDESGNPPSGNEVDESADHRTEGMLRDAIRRAVEKGVEAGIGTLNRTDKVIKGVVGGAGGKGDGGTADADASGTAVQGDRSPQKPTSQSAYGAYGPGSEQVGGSVGSDYPYPGSYTNSYGYDSGSYSYNSNNNELFPNSKNNSKDPLKDTAHIMHQRKELS